MFDWNAVKRAAFAAPKALLNAELDPALDRIFDRLEFVFARLERWIPALRPVKIRRSLDRNKLATVDEARERFLPIRFAVVVERLVADARTADDRKRRRVFAEMCAARFHFDFLFRAQRLESDFVPFDPDSDARYEKSFSRSEIRALRDDFLVELKKLLVDSNFFEIPSEELARCLRFKRPGALPVAARYDDFVEYRVFARGVVPTEPIRYPRWKSGGRIVEIESETLSRVCVLARLKKSDDATKIEQSAADANVESESEQEQEIVVKLFKNVAIEDLKLIAPRVEIAFQLFDGLKIGGFFVGGLATSAAKLLLAATITIFGFLVMLFGFVLALIKSAFGLLNKRTSYLQKYSKTLYFKNLASNRAAISLLVSMAEEQEMKETLIGYFAALDANDWATEREIDERAERRLREEFGLAIDFESSDALRKLAEKKLVETKIERGPDGAERRLYRVLDLDDALRRLDADWDAFYKFPPEETPSR